MTMNARLTITVGQLFSMFVLNICFTTGVVRKVQRARYKQTFCFPGTITLLKTDVICIAACAFRFVDIDFFYVIN